MSTTAGIFTRLDTLIIRVRDLAVSREWYREKLGLAPVFDDVATGIVVFGIGEGTSLTLWQLMPHETPPSDGVTRAYPIFAADDVDAVRELLAGRGVRVTGIWEGGPVRAFFFYDPDGNQLEAVQMVEGA